MNATTKRRRKGKLGRYKAAQWEIDMLAELKVENEARFDRADRNPKYASWTDVEVIGTRARLQLMVEYGV